MNKYNDEEKLIYEIDDNGGQKLALRYDLTIPLDGLQKIKQKKLEDIVQVKFIEEIIQIYHKDALGNFIKLILIFQEKIVLIIQQKF